MQAEQAILVGNANITSSGKSNQVRLQGQNVDLSVLQQVVRQNPAAPVSGEWIQQNIQVDRQIEFGSEAYMELARDPELRPYLQGGANVLFVYDREVISVRKASDEAAAEVQGVQEAKESALGALVGLVVSLVRRIAAGLVRAF